MKALIVLRQIAAAAEAKKSEINGDNHNREDILLRKLLVESDNPGSIARGSWWCSLVRTRGSIKRRLLCELGLGVVMKGCNPNLEYISRRCDMEGI